MPITPAFDLEFQLRYPTTSSLLQITDTTAYPPPLTDYSVSVTAYGPTGVPLGTTTIDPNVSLVATLPLPLDVGGAVQCGQYRVVCLTTDTSGGPPVEYRTEYTVQFCEAAPVFTPVWQNNCVVTPLVSVADQTPYVGTAVSRTMTLYPPSAAPYNTPITSTGMSVNSGSVDVYSGVWSVGINAIYLVSGSSFDWSYEVTQYATNNGRLVPDTTKDVQCGQLCSVNCCMNAAWDRWYAAYQDNAANRDDLLWQYVQADAIYSRALRDMDCGNDPLVSLRVQQIREILNCTDDCGDCSSESGGLIVPRYEGSAITIDMTGVGSVTVSPSSGTSFTVSLTALAENTIANAFNRNVLTTIAGFSWSEAVDNTTTPPTRTATLAFTGEFPAAIQLYTERISLSFAGGSVLVTRTNQIVRGSILKIPVTMTAVGGSDVSWLSLPAVLNVGDFYTTAPDPADPIAYKMIVAPINSDYAGAALAASSSGVTISVDGGTATGNSNNSAYATIRGSVSGLPMTWGDLRSLTRSIDIEIIIHANA